MEKFADLVNYCLNCVAKPCKKGCPLSNDIPSFIKAAKDNKFLDAFNILSETTVLSSICGRICPFNKQCEGNCVRRLKGSPVQIGEIEAKIGDVAAENNYPIFAEMSLEKKQKVAIIGSGPAGLTCGAFLRKMGYQVTIFEKYNYVGGIISHGIPEFRLAHDVASINFKRILDLGIDVEFNKELGKNISLKKLKKKFDAVFLGFGANKSKIPNIKGKKLPNVYGANEFLESRKTIDLTGKTVVVVGGGDVAMDMARTAKKWGANVLVVYRGSESSMKADKFQIEMAKKECIDFIYNTNLKQIINMRNCYRAYLVNDKGQQFVFPCNYVFFAIGSEPDERVTKKLGIKLDIDGYVKTDKKQMTSMSGVFAGGDLIKENRSVAYAAKSGREAAYSIDDYLKKLTKK